MKLTQWSSVLILAHVTVMYALTDPFANADYVRSQKVFNTGSVTRIEITMDPADALLLLEPQHVKRAFGKPPKEVVESIRQPWWYYTNMLYCCTMHFSNDLIDTTIRPVGIGLRGNNSRRLPKKSYKIDLDYYDKNVHIESIRKIKLLAEAKDNSQIRSFLASLLGQAVKIPMYRAGLCILYINGKCIGIYTMAEQENSDFLEMHFGTSGGTLYTTRKFKRWPQWPPRGGMGSLYEASLALRPKNDYDTYGRGLVYELDRDRARAGYGPLTNLINFLATAPSNVFEQEIEQRFNVEGFMRYQALEILLGNGDGYWVSGNNYYLLNELVANRIEFFARDMSNCLGIDELGKNSIHPSTSQFDARNIKRYLRTSSVALDWSSRDVRHWGPRDIPWGGTHTWYWGPLEKNKPLVDRILAIPRFRRLLHQYMADFACGPFSLSNMTALARQAHGTLAPYVAEYEAHRTYRRGLGFNLDMNKNATALDEPSRYRPLNIIDPIWGGFICMGVLPYVSNRIATLAHQLDPMLVALNEVVMRNTSGITNDAGARSAWLELYNPSFQEVNCTGLALQCNDSEPWALPAVTIPARGFLLVWLDAQAQAGPLHTPFSIAVNDTLRLWYNGAEMDRMTMPTTLAPNQSYGRKIEWTGYERRFVRPTPGQPN